MSSMISTNWIEYQRRLKIAIDQINLSQVQLLADRMLDNWKHGRQVFICGNGGSGGNAIHLANDFLYGISKEIGHALRVHALTANSSVITCLANDTGYENIFSAQLAVYGNPGDLCLIFSGSGNSENVINVANTAKEKGLITSAILGYDGGVILKMVDIPIHVPVHDMQISEDLQLVIGHMIMQYLYEHKDHI